MRTRARPVSALFKEAQELEQSFTTVENRLIECYVRATKLWKSLGRVTEERRCGAIIAILRMPGDKYRIDVVKLADLVGLRCDETFTSVERLIDEKQEPYVPDEFKIQPDLADNMYGLRTATAEFAQYMPWQTEAHY